MVMEQSLAIPEPLKGVHLAISTAEVETAFQNSATLRQIVASRLKRDIHFMKLPSARGPRDVLLDPGAALIRNGFNLYSTHKLMERSEDDEGHVRYVIQAILVHREFQVPVSGGVGSASSREVKYAYRWVREEDIPPELEHTTLKSRDTASGPLYRVSNPELGDLENTLLKMAAKRAEIDATLQLPGCGELFTQDIVPAPSGQKAAQVNLGICSLHNEAWQPGGVSQAGKHYGPWHEMPQGRRCWKPRAAAPSIPTESPPLEEPPLEEPPVG